MDTINKRIRILRKEKNITQEELSKLLHVGKSTISNYETGYSTPETETIQELAKIFGVSVDYLISGSDEVKTLTDDLEEDFPEGVRILRRASKELTPSQKSKMVKVVKAWLEAETNDTDK